MRLSFKSLGAALRLASKACLSQCLLMPDTFPLQMLAAGQRARIDQLVGRPDEVHRLQELGMRVGTSVEMLQSGSTVHREARRRTAGLSRSRRFSRAGATGRSRVSTLAQLPVGSRAKVARIEGVDELAAG